MICPKCKLQLFIKSKGYVVENDTDNEPTKLFMEQPLVCRNQKCNNFGRIVTVVRSEVPLSTTQVEDINTQESEKIQD